MILDGNLQFDPANTSVATTNTVSTNILDLNNNRDLGIGRHQGKIIVIVNQSFGSATASATLNVQLKGAPDNGSASPGTYQLIGESGVIPLGFLSKGYKAAQFDIPPIGDAVGSLGPAGCTLTTTSASTSATVSSATGLLAGMEVVATGIVPGTTISSISGTTLTLSTNATAAGTNVAVAFLGSNVPYRYLELNYVCSATMTAGTVQSYVSLDPDEMVFYPPGVVVAN